MNNTVMTSVGSLVEARTRANLERDFGMRLPPAITGHAFEDAGLFDDDRPQEVTRPSLWGRGVAFLKAASEIGVVRCAALTPQMMRILGLRFAPR